MHIKPVSEVAAKYIRNSIKAYLEGEQSLTWITGVILRSSDKAEAREMLIELRHYPSDATRYRELSDWLLSGEANRP